MRTISNLAGLYRAARAGEARALDRLLERVQEPLRRSIRARLGRRLARELDGEDLLQRSLLAFTRALPGYPEELSDEALTARLFRISQRELLTVARRVRRGRESGFRLELLRSETPGTGPVTRADERRRVRQIVAGLPPKYGEVVRCRLLEGLGVEETARRLGVSSTVVRKRMVRIRGTLERRLAPVRGSREQ